jgi:hypothetical protein
MAFRSTGWGLMAAEEGCVEMEVRGALDPHLACRCQAIDVDTLGHHNLHGGLVKGTTPL